MEEGSPPPAGSGISFDLARYWLEQYRAAARAEAALIRVIERALDRPLGNGEHRSQPLRRDPAPDGEGRD